MAKPHRITKAGPVVQLHFCSYNIGVTGLRFEWDEAKNLSNQCKHGVSFEEAIQVFLDPLNVLVADRVVDGEQRWQTLGLARKASGSLLLLCIRPSKYILPFVFLLC